MSTFVKNISMRIKLLTAAILSVIFSVSCNNGNETANANENQLEGLLKIKNEAGLKEKFGNDHISYDTIWGAEGSFTMGTYIDQGTDDEVEIYWEDSLNRSGIASASVHAQWQENGDYKYNSKWISASGVKLGMTTDELEKLNGKPFTFSGFGWDYGGGIMSWNDGKLEKFGIGVTLTDGMDDKVSDEELNEILGDQEVSSDNAVVKKTQPRVNAISVY